MENIYYVYALLDPRKPGSFAYENFICNFAPFYIGKGKRYRIKVHTQKASIDYKRNHKNRTIKKILDEGLEPIEFFIEMNLEEESAYSLEEKVINEIGLSNLTNCWPGGKGGRHNKNFAGKHHSEESKAKMRAAHLGEKNPMAGDKWHRTQDGVNAFREKCSGEKHPRYGKCVDEDVKEKIREKLKGIPMSNEEKIKRSDGLRAMWEKRRMGLLPNRKGMNVYVIRIHKDSSQDEHKFISKKECCNYLEINLRTLNNCINTSIKIKDYTITWI